MDDDDQPALPLQPPPDEPPPIDDPRHEAFLEGLRRSTVGIACYFHWVHRYIGQRWFLIGPRREAPHVGVAEQFADVYDLLQWVDGGPEIPVQVKHVHAFDFSCRADWPYRRCLLSKVKNHLRAPENTVHAILSRNKKHIALIGPDTRHLWYEVKVLTQPDNIWQKFMACPLGCLIFCPTNRKLEVIPPWF